MDIADRIGLLPGFGWIADHGFWVTLVICVAITPVGHLVIGFVGESRLVPITPSKQFLSFFPGDLFLGVMAAGLLWLAKDLPDGERWYNSAWWHLVVLAVVLAVAALATYGEWKSGVYPTQAIFSPTKLYHNGLLYGGYGYVLVTTLVALVAGGQLSGRFALVLLPGLVWAALVVHDSTLKPADATHKAKFAHVDDWEPIWSMP